VLILYVSEAVLITFCVFHTASLLFLLSFYSFVCFYCVLLYFSYFVGGCQCLATLPSCSCQCFISMCDFFIDEQINDDDDDDDDMVSKSRYYVFKMFIFNKLSIVLYSVHWYRYMFILES